MTRAPSGQHHPFELVRELTAREFSISDLARLVGANRSLVSEALRAGRLSPRLVSALGELLQLPDDEIRAAAASYREGLLAEMRVGAVVRRHPVIVSRGARR